MGYVIQSKMGIPGLFKHLLDNYKSDIVISSIQPCDYLLFDYNCLIHHCKYDENMFETIVTYTNEIIALVKPKIATFIAIDGLPPLAKMMQQRTRRYMSVYERKFKKQVPAFNSNAITPGTQFMKNLSAYLAEAFANSPQVVLSSWEEDGEGEHKLFNFLKGRRGTGTQVCIYGLDADMVMLSLLHNTEYDITLLRERDQMTKTKHIAPKDFQIVHIRSLHRCLAAQMNGGRVIDYIPLGMLVGNDFLPPMTHLHVKRDMEYLIQTYNAVVEETREHFVNADGAINFKFLIALFAKLKVDEDQRMLAAHNKYYSAKPKRHLDAWENIPATMKLWPDTIMPQTTGWRMNYYSTLFGPQTSISSVVENYLEGLSWNMQYYTKHVTEWQWTYNHSYSPTMVDCYNYLLAASKLPTRSKAAERLELNHTIQLITVIPPEDKNLVPEKYRKIYSTVSLGCSHMFPVTFKIQTYLKEKTHECIPIIPRPIIRQIVNAVKSV